MFAATYILRYTRSRNYLRRHYSYPDSYKKLSPSPPQLCINVDLRAHHFQLQTGFTLYSKILVLLYATNMFLLVEKGCKVWAFSFSLLFAYFSIILPAIGICI